MVEEQKIVEERIYTIPLRKDWVKTSRVKRANRAVNVIKSFLSRHMHSDIIKISPEVNDVIWKRGAKKPPAKIKVKVTKDDKGVVEVMLPETVKHKEEKKEEKAKKEQKEEPVEKKPEKESKNKATSQTTQKTTKKEEQKKNNKTASKK
jgi:large subunit ribosomal protein L31e